MRRRKLRWVLIGVAVLGLLLIIFGINFRAFDTTGEKVYVATTGNDNNDGSIDHPFLTFDKARNRARQIKTSDPSIPVTVLVRGGTYYMTAPLNLTASDSGSAGAPITYKNYPGEQATITGAKTITGFTSITDPAILARLPVGAQANTKVVNLPSLGITDYGSLSRRGGPINNPPSSGLELFYNGERQTLARYPNVGSWDTVAAIGPDPTKSFVYTDSRPASWPDYNDVWVHGYWKYDWADSHVKIANLNTASKTITVETGFDDWGYGLAVNQGFYYENELNEIDSPGEYYLDRQNGNLYFWSPTDPNTAKITVSVADKLMTANGVSYVNFDHLNFEGTRSTLVKFSNSSFLKFNNDNFLDSGNDALILDVVTDTTVAGSTFNQLAERALYLRGGDRTNLASSKNVIINNDFQNTSQWVRTFRAAVDVAGVGHRISHNNFANMPQAAITYSSSNDLVIEYNTFSKIVLECLDCGAVYSGRDYTARGTTLRYNKFVDIGGFQGKVQNSIYWDDGTSGQIADSNFFDNAGRAILVGGGRDNQFTNNVMVNLSKPIEFDSRGVCSPDWSEWMCSRYYNRITDATNTTPIVITLANPHGISGPTAPGTMDVVGVTGNTAANGTGLSYEVVSANQLRLLNTVGNGGYTGGGDVISTGSLLTSQLDALNRNGPYSKYSNIFNYTRYTLGEPVRNIFARNVIYFGNKPAGPWIHMYRTTPPYLDFTDGIINGSDNTPAIPPGNSTADPQFVNTAGGDYHLKQTSPIWVAGGFKELPYEWMGLVTTDQLLSAIPDKTVKVGESLSLTAVSTYFATDQAKNPVFTASGLPSGATFNSVTKKISWTPTTDQVGVYNITVNASDDYLSADRTFKVTVSEADRTGGSGGDNGGSGGSSGSTTTPPGSGTSSDYILPPPVTPPAPVSSGVIQTVKEATKASASTIGKAVREKVTPIANKIPTKTTVVSAVHEVLLDPLTGKGTPRGINILTGILLIIVLPLVVSITIVVLHRRIRT